MYHYPEDQYYVLFGRECCYFDEDMYNEQQIDNVWDYYFEQPHTHAIPHKENIISEVGLLQDEWSEFRDIYIDSKEEYQKIRKEYNAIINKHIKLLPHVKEKLYSFYENNLKNKKILGLHCRGTDHPDKLPMDNYVDVINKKLVDYDALFVTSDEQSRVDYIVNTFKNKVIVYPTFRSNSESPLHYQNYHNYNKYFVGEEVLIEAYLLSMTNHLMCCTASNVNFYVRALNPNLNYTML
jgi:hypothetical protein